MSLKDRLEAVREEERRLSLLIENVDQGREALARMTEVIRLDDEFRWMFRQAGLSPWESFNWTLDCLAENEMIAGYEVLVALRDTLPLFSKDDRVRWTSSRIDGGLEVTAYWPAGEDRECVWSCKAQVLVSHDANGLRLDPFGFSAGSLVLGSLVSGRGRVVTFVSDELAVYAAQQWAQYRGRCALRGED